MDGYYDYWAAQGTFLRGFTLRSSGSIAAAAGSGPVYTYDAADNSMKVLWSQEAVNAPGGFGSSTQPTLQIDVTTGEATIIFHIKYEGGWRPVGIGDGAIHPGMFQYSHKEVTVRGQPAAGGNGGKHWETRAHFTNSGGDPFGRIDDSSIECCTLDQRLYSGTPPLIQGLTDNEPYIPPGRFGLEEVDHYSYRFDEWVRHVIRIKVGCTRADFPKWESDRGVTLDDVPYHRVSHYIQTARGITRCIYEVPILDRDGTAGNRARLDYLEWEQNTSSKMPPATGTVRFTGTPGTLIAANQTLSYASTGGQYEHDQPNANIAGDGTLIRNITSTNSKGPALNLASGTFLTVDSPPAGCDPTAEVVTALTGADWQFSRDLEIHGRDMFVLHNYSSAAWDSDTPENDTAIFADMAAWAA